MRGLGTIAFAVLLGCAFFAPAAGGWAFAAAEFAFLAWLASSLRKADASALRARARPPLEPDEDEIVARYPFYFARPLLARDLASTLAALGLASLLLVPWLTYRVQWAQAILIGVFVFAVARLTRVLSPVLTLRSRYGERRPRGAAPALRARRRGAQAVSPRSARSRWRTPAAGIARN